MGEATDEEAMFRVRSREARGEVSGGLRARAVSGMSWYGAKLAMMSEPGEMCWETMETRINAAESQGEDFQGEVVPASRSVT